MVLYTNWPLTKIEGIKIKFFCLSNNNKIRQETDDVQRNVYSFNLFLLMNTTKERIINPQKERIKSLRPNENISILSTDRESRLVRMIKENTIRKPATPLLRAA